MAKTRNKVKKRRLGIQCVLKILPTLGPKMPIEKSAPSKVNINTIDKPKKIPVRIDFERFSLPLIKNETVIGIMGKTHGVRTPANPANADIKRKSHKDCTLAPEELDAGT